MEHIQIGVTFTQEQCQSIGDIHISNVCESIERGDDMQGKRMSEVEFEAFLLDTLGISLVEFKKW